MNGQDEPASNKGKNSRLKLNKKGSNKNPKRSERSNMASHPNDHSQAASNFHTTPSVGNARWAHKDDAENSIPPIKLNLNAMVERYLATTNSNEFEIRIMEDWLMRR